MLKQLVYNCDHYKRCGKPPVTLESQVLKDLDATRKAVYDAAQQRKLHSLVVPVAKATNPT